MVVIDITFGKSGSKGSGRDVSKVRFTFPFSVVDHRVYLL